MGVIGAFLVLFTVGATAAALIQPILAIWHTIVNYLRGIYGHRSTRTDSDER